MENDRIKVLFLADHPMVSSGVGSQARYVMEGLLATGRFKFYCFGGAVKHPDYRLQQISPEKFGEGNWIVQPVDGYGSKEQMRVALREQKPDVVVLFTDPRQFVWVWEMEDEIRKQCPIVYWHVWDNDPAPKFNMPFYDSNDHISALSMKTYKMLKELEFKRCNYIPHAVDPNVFKPVSEDECKKFKLERFGPHTDKDFVLFWNNRNARRKMTGDVIATFAKFAKKIGKNKVALVMHTQIGDPEGQDIISVAKCFDIESSLVVSQDRVPPEFMNMFYNACDCTINIANNEGFGLGTLESLMAGTPIVVNMTGGLQYQIGDWYDDLDNVFDQDELLSIAKKRYNKSLNGQGNFKWWGIPLFPASRSCTGSQQIPYIYDDRVSHNDVVNALTKLYELGRSGRRELGSQASNWARKTFNFDDMIVSWDKMLTEQVKLYKMLTVRDNDLKIVTI
jgi:glycosyltransferase involved in cell wall biosynthesis